MGKEYAWSNMTGFTEEDLISFSGQGKVGLCQQQMLLFNLEKRRQTKVPALYNGMWLPQAVI